MRVWFSAEETLPFALWSASMPLIWLESADRPSRFQPGGVLTHRWWNGRPLAAHEVHSCLRVFLQEWDRTQCVGYAVQAAYEFLSEHCEGAAQ